MRGIQLRWIPFTKGQQCRKHFQVIQPSCGPGSLNTAPGPDIIPHVIQEFSANLFFKSIDNVIPYSLYQINSPTLLYTTISYYNTCRSQSYHPDHQSHPNLWKLLSWIHRLFYVDLMLVSDGQLSLHCLFRCYRYSTHWDLEEILEKYFQAKFSDRCLWHLLWNCPQMDVNKPYWWRTNIGSSNDLALSGKKPLPEPMLTQIFDAICASLGHNELRSGCYWCWGWLDDNYMNYPSMQSVRWHFLL